MRRRTTVLTLALVTGCDSGGSASTTPTMTPNAAPTVQVPAGLTQVDGRYLAVLPAGTRAVLTFTASDPDGDPLFWTLPSSLAGAAPVPHAPSPIPGPTLTLEFSGTGTAGAFGLMVSDDRGGSTSIDVRVQRPIPVTVTKVEPDTAFASAPRTVRVLGNWQQPPSAVGPGMSQSTVERVTFGGVEATILGQPELSRVTCETPVTTPLGGSNVQLTTVEWGASNVLQGAFEMLGYPVDLLDSDLPFDGGAGERLAVAEDGGELYAAYVENGTLWERRSQDLGRQWSTPTAISQLGVVGVPQVHLSAVWLTAAAWVEPGGLVRLRASALLSQATYDRILGGAAQSPDARLRLGGTSGTMFCAWLHGDPAVGAQRVHGCASTDAGASWTSATALASVPVNTLDFALVTSGHTACVPFVTDSAGVHSIYVTRTTNGGATWTTTAPPVAPSATVAGRVWACADFPRVHVVYADGGELRCVTSEDGGATWPAPSRALGTSAFGAVGDSVDLACEGDRIWASYDTSAQQVVCSRLDGSGGPAQHALLSQVAEPVGEVTMRGEDAYVFCAWRGGEVATGAARIRLATSVDRGATFTPAVGFGDGTAAQERPALMQDSARIWLGWSDHRGAAPALFENRTER
jgi:hypothetical protein